MSLWELSPRLSAAWEGGEDGEGSQEASALSLLMRLPPYFFSLAVLPRPSSPGSRSLWLRVL